MFTEQSGCSDPSDKPRGDCWGTGPGEPVSEGRVGCCLPCSASLCASLTQPASEEPVLRTRGGDGKQQLG